MRAVKLIILAVLCCLSLTACGGTGGGSGPTPVATNAGSSDGLAGDPSQPFAQRVAQTSYPTTSLLNNPEAMKRIVGEDKDNNGIRDDIDGVIHSLGGDRAELGAYQQYARTIQKRFLVATKKEAYAAADASARALKCFSKVAKNKFSGVEKDEAIDSYIKNSVSILRKSINSVERVFRADEVSGLTHAHTSAFDPLEDVSNACD